MLGARPTSNLEQVFAESNVLGYSNAGSGGIDLSSANFGAAGAIMGIGSALSGIGSGIASYIYGSRAQDIMFDANSDHLDKNQEYARVASEMQIDALEAQEKSTANQVEVAALANAAIENRKRAEDELLVQKKIAAEDKATQKEAAKKTAQLKLPEGGVKQLIKDARDKYAYGTPLSV